MQNRPPNTSDSDGTTPVSSRNSLLTNFSALQLNADNFDTYKENVSVALTALLASFLGTRYELSPTTSISDIARIFSPVMEKSKPLEEYCTLFHSYNIPLGYKTLAEVCHQSKGFAGTVISLSELPDMTMPGIRNFVDGIIDSIKTKKVKIAGLSYSAESVIRTDVFYPHEYVGTILTSQEASLRQKGITVDTVLDKQSLLSYPEVFDIAMQNLITNAIKFTPDNGKIIVGRNTLDVEYDTFSVQDSGSGIPDTVDVFVPGYTTQGTNGEVGTGIGLSGAKSFVDKIGGKLWHEKGPDNIGTIFFLSLPKVEKKS